MGGGMLINNSKLDKGCFPHVYLASAPALLLCCVPVHSC